ncbi:aminotransferase class I/II-fold pyridoxal phosphate-dependent enzyme [Croceibacter atlanticus]|mgnify:FL=1|jgi:dTDP-4-amino-4,6-dideoxygalactose transaminase|uniref:aminotransferase class I/II-fold pyridoxal phosphate-dependent enzyme n=1 Tax=Croceibacter atlanticus TaxID=313588 RepID=UPI0024BAC300|nr:aminotransferase class I/II-fold pyridoxal phosphate-dependent enzyme [Croceibacter atlanticus]
MNSKIWLSSPHMGGNELSYINEAFNANWIAPLGPNVNNFEESIKTYLGNGVEVAALSSGTAALHLALILLGVSKDDEVICQSFTFAASANPIIYQGATPVFVDSEPDTWNICPKHLKFAIEDRIQKGKKPKAIIAVHLYGMPYKADALNEISKEYNIPIIEDSAEALGSTYKNKNCGTLGDISILSFNGNKIITTSGGGALVSKLPVHKEKAVFLATQARDQAPHYQHTQIGYNYRMSNISAGIGRGQMEVLDDHVNLRRRMNSFYKDLFSSIDDVTVFEEPNSDYYSNHWLSAIIVNETNGKSREGLRVYLETLNIESRPLWKPMHMQPVFSNAAFYGTNVAENLFKYGLCLPSGSNLEEHEINRIKEGILNYFQ